MASTRPMRSILVLAFFLAGAADPAESPPAAERLLELRGRVVDASGSALPGVRVALESMTGGDGEKARLVTEAEAPPPAAVATSDGEGRYRLPVPRPGIWRLVARTDGFATLELRPVPVVAAMHLPPAVLRPAEDEFRPDPPAEGWTPVRRPAAPDAGSRAVLTGRTAAPPAPPAALPARRPALPKGKVLDADSRQPVAGALVWNLAEPAAFGFSAADGRFRPQASREERFVLQVEAPGYLPGTVRVGRSAVRAGRLPTLALHRAATLAGTVVGPGGRPLAGATLSARLDGSARRPFFRFAIEDGRTVTGADGAFRLSGLVPHADYAVLVEHDDLAGAIVLWTAPGPGRSSEPRRLQLDRGRALRGRAVTADGRGIPAAEVTLHPATAGSAWRRFSSLRPEDGPCRAAADAAGRFAFAAAPSRTVDLTVRAEGFTELNLRGLEIPPGDGAFDLGRLVLPRGATLAGRVVDRAGEGVAGVAVHRVEARRRPGGRDRQRLARGSPDAVSAADGGFRIADAPAGRRTGLLFLADGYAPSWLPGVRVPAESLAVTLDRALSVRGRVLDENGEPIPAAAVHLTWEEISPRSLRRRRVGEPLSARERTDLDGGFVFEGLRPGEATLEARAEGHVPSEPLVLDLPLADGETGAVVFELAAGAAVAGRVTTEGGEPIAGVRIRGGSTSARSDAEGLYRLEGLPAGPAELRATHPHYEAQSATLEVEPGVQRLDWRFPGGRELAGIVVDGDGLPVGGAEVELAPHEVWQRRRYRATSDADGTFRLRPVADGRYRARARKSGFADSSWREVAAAGEPVGGEPAGRLELALRRAATVEGRLVDLDLLELGRVRVTAAGEEGERTAEVSPGGRYRLADLPPGDWRVRALLDGGEREARRWVRVPEGARLTDQDLVFGDGLTVTGEATYDGEPLGSARVALAALGRSLRRSVLADHGGGFRFEDLPAGSYRLELVSSRNFLVHNRRLEVTADRHLRLELSSAAVRGRVENAADGAPVADAILRFERIPDGAGSVPFVLSTASFEEGLFEVPSAPPGRYRASVQKDGFSPVETVLEVAAGRDVEGFDVALSPTPGLDLEVRLADGRVPPYVHLRIEDAEGRAVVRETRPLDAGGRARLPTVPPGTWRLVAGAPGGALAEAPVRVPESRTPANPAVVVLPVAGRVEVRIPALQAGDTLAAVTAVGGGGQALAGLGAAGGYLREWPMTFGRAAVDGVPAGLWTVYVTAADGRSWSRSVEVGGGNKIEVVID